MQALSLFLAIGLLAAADVQPIAVSVPRRDQPVSYANEVSEFLAERCVGCHSSALAENKLNLEDVAGMLKGGKSGPAIVAGKADESLMFLMAAHRKEPAMPPVDKPQNKPLTPEELGLLKLWIDQGAKDDSDTEAAPVPRTIELGTLPPGVRPITAVDITADGRLVAAGRANLVQVYDVASGLEIVSLAGHKDLIQSLRFSPDGRMLAAGGYQIATVWDVPKGAELKTFKGHEGALKAVAVAPDVRSFVTAGLDPTIRIWDAARGEELRRWEAPGGPTHALAISPDGRTIASGGADGRVRLWNSADGALKQTLEGHAGPVNGLAFLPDNRRLASASADGTARLWSLIAVEGRPAFETLVMTGHEGPVHAVAATPDGRFVITAGEDKSVRLWHADDGKASRTLQGHEGPVLALAVAPSGGLLITGSADRTARIFELPSGRLLHALTGHDGPVSSVAFAPDGRLVLTAGPNGGIKLWDAATGAGFLAFGHRAPDNAPGQAIAQAAFLGPNGVVSASADKTIKTWSFEGAWGARPPLGPHVFRVLALDFSPDGKLLAAGGGEPSRSGEVKVWDLATGTLKLDLGSLHSDTVFGLRFSPDGTKLASGGADKFLKVVSVQDGKELRSFEGHTHHVMTVDWKADGKELASGGADNVVKVWDYESGEQKRTLQAAGKQITSIRWLPTGQPRVAGAAGDAQVRLWNPDNGQVARTFTGPSDYLFGVAVSSDGKVLAAGGAESALFLWNAENGQVLRKIEQPAPSATP